MDEDSYLGEPVDFDLFFRREHPRVLAFARALLRNPAAAEDVTQDAFTAVYRKLAEGKQVMNPNGFVRTAVANSCRSSFRRKLIEARASKYLGRAPASPAPLPEPSERFWSAVRALPPRQAQVVALYYLEDRPVADVAALLELAEGTVKAHLHRARVALAVTLGVEDGEDAT